MVDRYNGIEKDPEGAYVYYQDYEALEAEIARLEEIIKNWDSEVSDRGGESQLKNLINSEV